jgi:hypothetical protein|tara:strand:+ start:1360 stop:1479 length:120 start_codon:yes stop_codon:yes gene_type:complete
MIKEITIVLILAFVFIAIGAVVEDKYEIISDFSEKPLDK